MIQDKQVSAAERERNKTAEQKAVDVAYTINHALVCAATDIIDPFVAAWSQKNFGKQIHTSWCNMSHDHGEDAACNHDHGHDHNHNHEHQHNHNHDHHHHEVSFGGALKHWVIGEAIGDIGAVPVAIAMQRYAPNFMEWINGGMEKIFGNTYRKSADKAAMTWALENNITPGNPVVKQYGDELYRHEVHHFGQAVVWTVASVGLNIASQKLITGNRHPVSHMLLYKSLGAATSATLLFGGRAAAPKKFQSWDKWTSENIFTPATKSVGKLFGVDEQTVDNTVKKDASVYDDNWVAKAKRYEEQMKTSGEELAKR